MIDIYMMQYVHNIYMYIDKYVIYYYYIYI